MLNVEGHNIYAGIGKLGRPRRQPASGYMYQLWMLAFELYCK